MKLWHLQSLEGSSEKRTERAWGANAPRVPATGRQQPRVLFSSPQCRAIVLDLQRNENMGEHEVRERALVQVVSGRVMIDVDGETSECDAGALVMFEPGERHAVRCIEDSRLLLILAPWPAPRADATPEGADDQHLPANAVEKPARWKNAARPDGLAGAHGDTSTEGLANG